MKIYIVEVEHMYSGNRNINYKGYKSIEEVKQMCLPHMVKELNPYTYIAEESGEIYRIHEIHI